MNQSYSKKLEDVGDWKIDLKLSGPRTQGHSNKNDDRVVIAHRGTNDIEDAIDDLAMLAGFRTSQRFVHAQRVQRDAIEKYGKDNYITGIGHSLGAAVAESLGEQCDETITLNKPVTPIDVVTTWVPVNQQDIKTTRDPVSVLRPLQSGNDAMYIPSTTWNLNTEHSINTINRLPDGTVLGYPFKWSPPPEGDTVIGKGLHNKIQKQKKKKT